MNSNFLYWNIDYILCVRSCSSQSQVRVHMQNNWLTLDECFDRKAWKWWLADLPITEAELLEQKSEINQVGGEVLWTGDRIKVWWLTLRQCPNSSAMFWYTTITSTFMNPRPLHVASPVASSVTEFTTFNKCFLVLERWGRRALIPVLMTT